MDSFKIKERIITIANILWAIGVFGVSVWILARTYAEYPIITDILSVWVGVYFSILCGGMLIAWRDKHEYDVKRVAKGNFFRNVWWDWSHKDGYFAHIKSMATKQYWFLIGVLDDFLVFIRSILVFVGWFIISMFSVVGLWLFIRFFLIKSRAQAITREQHEIARVIRQQWPIFCEQRGYRKKNQHERNKLRKEFCNAWKLKDMTILDSLEAQVMKGRK